jgi:hypothetical protein
MSTVPIRKLTVKPLHLGPYSQAIVLPAWWLKLNNYPKKIEVGFTLDSLILTPVEEKKGNVAELSNTTGDK